MTIYFQELRSYRKFTLIWSSSLILLYCLYFSIYPTVIHDAETFLKMMENYPDELKVMMGLTNNITSVLGYYAFTLKFIVLCAGIQAFHIGLSIISKEEREKTVDFLLTKPISRIQIVIEKILSGLTTIIVTMIVFFVLAKLFTDIITTTPYNNTQYIQMTFSILLVQVMFFAIGILLSVLLRRIKSVLPISLGVVFAFFFFASFVVDVNRDSFLRYFTPFTYFDPSLIYEKGYEWQYVFVSILLSIGLIGLSLFIYQRKDIHAV